MINEPFNFVLADPPWKFKVFSEKGMSRSAENHYPCMSNEDIMELPVESVMADDAVCMMWVTPPFLAIGLETLRKWGFTYKTMGGWVKVKDGKLQRGTGYHLRACMEPFIVGTRGKGFCPAPGTQKPACMVSEHSAFSMLDEDGYFEPEDYFIERTVHSAKPLECYDYCELYPGPHLELFARNSREGWTALGNEIDDPGEDIRDSLPKLIKQVGDGFSIDRQAVVKKKLRRMKWNNMNFKEACDLGFRSEWVDNILIQVAYNGGIQL